MSPKYSVYFAACLLSCQFALAAPSAKVVPKASIPKSAAPADATSKALSAMEQGTFGRVFDEDPVDKRLGRLELFTLRQRQEGSVEDRLAVLKIAIAKKQKASVSANSASGHGKSSSPASNARRLAVLEQHIMKKNFPGMDENARLSQLEKKVFGTSFPNISSNERISRLQKTMGVGEPETASIPGFRGSQSEHDFNHMYPGSPFSMGPSGMQMFGFSDDPEMNRQLTEAFRQMNKQMREMQQMPPGAHSFNFNDPQGNSSRGFSFHYSFPNDGSDANQIPNGQMPKRSFPNQLKPPAQHFLQPSEKESVPPYMDPNSI